MHYLAKARRKVSLVFADPPFNINYSYDVYKDKLEEKDYLWWTKRWLLACREVLDMYGSLYVAIGTGMQAEVKRVIDECGFYWRSTICWHYSFGPQQKGNWTSSWVAIHYYTIHKDIYTWNDEDVRVPSLRQLKYGDKRARAGGKIPDNVWILDPKGAEERGEAFLPGQDTWLHSRVCGTFKERTDHPCQMSEEIIGRIIRASTNPRDVVLDPFLGSGTTVAAAIKNQREGWGCELSEDYLTNICIPRVRSVLREVESK
jgi:site-specific DNA-methyltransferase (adenine-specific)